MLSGRNSVPPLGTSALGAPGTRRLKKEKREDGDLGDLGVFGVLGAESSSPIAEVRSWSLDAELRRSPGTETWSWPPDDELWDGSAMDAVLLAICGYVGWMWQREKSTL